MNSFGRFRVTSLALALSLLATLGIVTAPAPQAIVGGDQVSIEQVPWQALVYVPADNRLCGGAIIDSSWIVTAAHCIDGFGAGQVQANVGISSLSERSAQNSANVVNVYVHPAWDANRYRSDIALLQIDPPLTLGPNVQPVSLPSGLDPSTWPPTGQAATISGWGSTSFESSASNILRAGTVQILGSPTDVECGRYGSNFDVTVELCAGQPDASVDACQGDSGSPLVVDIAGTPVLTGITSVGFECAVVGYPGIYTRVPAFIPWLKEYVPDAFDTPAAPTNVTVSAIAGERLRLDWRPPLSTALVPVVSYQAFVEPGGALCQVPATEFACVIEGVSAGQLVTVTVTATDVGGATAAADPVQAVAVDGVTSVGVRMKPRRIATWAGLRVRPRDDIHLVVRPGSSNVCTRIGTRTKPSGVRATASGLCAVRAIVVRPDGTRKRGIAYVEVQQST